MTQNDLKALLDYDPETGVFKWRVNRGRINAGTIAGCETQNGGQRYRLIIVSRKRFYAHRLAWLYVYGVEPSEIDHKNVDGLDNRIENLRECTPSQNIANRKSWSKCGLKGVRFQSGKWTAQIYINKKHVHLGRFPSKDEAHAAYAAKAKEVFGDFARMS